MGGEMYLINPEAMLKLIMDINEGKTHSVSQIDCGLSHTEMRAPKGYIHSDTPLTDPYCINVLKAANDFFEKFPSCCEQHKKLLFTPWFNKINYDYVPGKIFATLLFSLHYIRTTINEDKWESIITTHFLLSIKSFGLLPYGYGAPVGLDVYKALLKEQIKGASTVPDNKKTILVEFLNFKAKPQQRDSNASFNILLTTYRKWLKIFPFDLPFFEHLKPMFETAIPILKGNPIANEDTNLIGYDIRTNDELIYLLTQINKSIITQINSMSLSKEGLLNDIQVTKLSLINSQRLLELKELTDEPTDERKDYIRVLKSWFEGEKKYVDEISNLVKQATEPAKRVEVRLGIDRIALIYFYERKQITRENADSVAAKYSYISKESGEGLFQDYTHYSDKSNRMGKPIPCTPSKLKNRIKKFESILANLTEDARKRAIDEIKILKIIYETEFC